MKHNLKVKQTRNLNKEKAINLHYACLTCLLSQTQSVAKNTRCCDEIALQNHIAQILPQSLGTLQELNPQDKAYLENLLKDFLKEKGVDLGENFEIPPTLLAILVYEKISDFVGKASLFKTLKHQSIFKAREIKENLQKKILPMLATIPPLEILELGIRCGALGNVIDYGAQKTFDLDLELTQIFTAPFAIFESESFLAKLWQSKNLLYIGDNAGENEFDEILIQILKHLNPTMKIFYFVRGFEIINDVTLEDLQTTQSKLFELCEVIDSGVGTPGFIPKLANAKAQEIFQQADLILAKGMGNFESLEVSADERLYLLFKIKCEVVACYLKKQLGDFVFMNATQKR